MGIPKYYRGNDSNWATDANWSQSSNGPADTTFPTGVDDAIFDAFSGNCTLDAAAAALSIAIGRIGSLYGASIGGTLNGGGFTMAVGTGGFDCTYGGSARWILGTGIWTISGDFDYCDIGTITRTGSTVVLDGVGVDMIGCWNKDLYNLTIALGASVNIPTASQTPQMDGIVRIDGALTITSGENFGIQAGGDLQLSSTGSIIGGIVKLYASAEMSVCDGTFNPSLMTIGLPNSGQRYDSGPEPLSGQWQCDVLVTDSNITTSSPYTFQLSGTVSITGSFTARSQNVGSTLNIANSVNSPSFLIGGDISIGGVGSNGTVTWTKGTGTITLNGDAAQAVNFAGEDTEAIIVNSSDVVTFAANTVATSFSAVAGDFDPAGYDITVGDFTIAPGVNLISAAQGTGLWDGVTIIAGGTFSVQGNSGDYCNLQGIAGWTCYTVTVGTVRYVTVSGSSVGAGSDIRAISSEDVSGNTGWLFSAARTLIDGGLSGGLLTSSLAA